MINKLYSFSVVKLNTNNRCLPTHVIMSQVCHTRHAYLHKVVLESLLPLSSHASPCHLCQCRDHGAEGVRGREKGRGREGRREGGKEGGREGGREGRREGGKEGGSEQ